MTLIDAHAHNYYNVKPVEYEKNVIVIETGTDHESNVKCLGLAKSNDTVRASIGWHPTNSYNEEGYLKAVEEIDFIQNNSKEIIAIGEIGLDYYHDKTEETKVWQKKTFVKYFKLAEELDLPIVVHARNAVKDVLELLEENKYSGKVIMHCMEASSKNIQIAIDRGYYFTIPASVGRNEMFQRLVLMVPISKMLTETDAPYQGPVKGETAQSKDVQFALEYIAKEINLDVIEVENIIQMNYHKVF